jgi:citrate synthase
MAPDDHDDAGMYDPGLSYTTVAQTNLSRLDPDAGELFVGGYPIEELADNASYEESVFLLLEDRLPTGDELSAFRDDLAQRRSISEPVRDVLSAAADSTSPMVALRAGLAAADIDTDSDDPRTAAKRVVAVIPTIVAAYWRLRQDRTPLTPDPELGHVANYLWLLSGEHPPSKRTEALETFCVTLLEHGLDASSFAARTAASAESDPVSAATAAVGTLKGDRHAGRFADAFALLDAARGADDPTALLRDRATQGQVPGFGHPVYRTRDPRAAVLSAALERTAPETAEQTLTTIQQLDDIAEDVFESGQSNQRPEVTVEFPATALLDSIDIPPALFPPTFAVARAGGWAAHTLEAYSSEALLRPSAAYVGETKTGWTPVENRHTAGDRLIARPPQSASLEPLSQTLDVLSEPNRLELLLALYDSDGPLGYSALLDASTIEDKGKLNYHLRTLRGSFVSDTDAGYTLTTAGERLVDAVVTNERLLGELK